MGDSAALVATVLAAVCGVLAAVQGVLPCRRRWARWGRAALQLLVSTGHVTALSLVTRAPSKAGFGVYIVSASVYLGAFTVLDIGREAAYLLRAPFTGIALNTTLAAIGTSTMAALHIAVAAAVLAVSNPSATGRYQYCGHIRYILRDIAPAFGGAVYALWALYEHSGVCCFGPWTRTSCAPKEDEDLRDDDERAIWVQHRVAAAISAEACFEILQTILVVCTAVYATTLAETAARRRDQCSGVVAAGERVMPLLAVSSTTLASRFVAARLRDAMGSRISS